MTTVARPTVVHTVFGKAYVSPPETHRHQLTHAVEGGLRIAMCGVSTNVRAGTWPADPTLWDSPLGRCPTCARVAYGTHERRA